MGASVITPCLLGRSSVPTLNASFTFGNRLINLRGIKVCKWLRKMRLGGTSLSERGVLADGCSVIFKKFLIRICKEPKLIYEDRSSFGFVQAVLSS